MGTLEPRVRRLESSGLGRATLRDQADALRYLTDDELDELHVLIGVAGGGAAQLIERAQQRRSSGHQACRP